MNMFVSSLAALTVNEITKILLAPSIERKFGKLVCYLFPHHKPSTNSTPLMMTSLTLREAIELRESNFEFLGQYPDINLYHSKICYMNNKQIDEPELGDDYYIILSPQKYKSYSHLDVGIRRDPPWGFSLFRRPFLQSHINRYPTPDFMMEDNVISPRTFNELINSSHDSANPPVPAPNFKVFPFNNEALTTLRTDYDVNLVAEFSTILNSGYSFHYQYESGLGPNDFITDLSDVKDLILYNRPIVLPVRYIDHANKTFADYQWLHDDPKEAYNLVNSRLLFRRHNSNDALISFGYKRKTYVTSPGAITYDFKPTYSR